MHRLLFLAVFFYQKTNGVYGIDCATTSYEAALVGRELDGITNAPVDNPLEDLHAMRKQSDWTISGTFFSAITWLKNVASHFVGYQDFEKKKKKTDRQTCLLLALALIFLPASEMFTAMDVTR
ncbi:unnamed protein product [Heligmosomoides polygyrus]|uniref:Cation_ATPase_C domain-containing protein n=1 Tax=Heligmosomoides polygyrus TaxID=6339 RepID=A0A183FF52_HELPZ|nr:unnamed protein product [Heligmosomoides polygyrus]